MLTAYHKSAAALLLGIGALVAATGFAADTGAKDKNCCELKSACCEAKRACCTQQTKAGCCAKGMTCCKNNQACCDKAPDCCTEGKACCTEGKDCCGAKGAKATANASCCHNDAASTVAIGPAVNR